MELRPISKDHLEEWRKKYRQQLGLPVIPDFYEGLCQMGQAYGIEDAGQALGYVILTPESMVPDLAPVIPELYLDVYQTQYTRELLQELINKLNPLTLLGRTDDAHIFPLLMDLRIPNQIAHSLYRMDREPQWAEDESLLLVESTLEDAPELLPLYASVAPEEGGIPDEMSLTKSLALWRHYRLLSEGEVLAVCYVVPQFQKYITVATIVRGTSRNKGFGRYVTAYAAKREIGEGKTFVAANNPENDAARGLLESLGAHLTAHLLYFRP